MSAEDPHGDREVLLAAVEQDGLALQYASHAMCDDIEVIKVAVSVDETVLEFVIF